jgi:hypothetical protein
MVAVQNKCLGMKDQAGTHGHTKMGDHALGHIRQGEASGQAGRNGREAVAAVDRRTPTAGGRLTQQPRGWWRLLMILPTAARLCLLNSSVDFRNKAYGQILRG